MPSVIRPPSLLRTDWPRTHMFVSKKQVKENMKKCTIVDARAPEVCSGMVKAPFCARASHIPGATCFPVPWMWMEQGLYRDI